MEKSLLNNDVTSEGTVSQRPVFSLGVFKHHIMHKIRNLQENKKRKKQACCVLFFQTPNRGFASDSVNNYLSEKSPLNNDVTSGNRFSRTSILTRCIQTSDQHKIRNLQEKKERKNKPVSFCSFRCRKKALRLNSFNIWGRNHRSTTTLLGNRFSQYFILSTVESTTTIGQKCPLENKQSHEPPYNMLPFCPAHD